MSEAPLLKLLLIDDDPAIHVVVRELLKLPPPANFVLVSAVTFVEGLAIVEQEKPDAILLDLNLTEDLRGEATIRRIPELPCPVLVLTGAGAQDLWVMAVDHGALNLLHKEIYLQPVHRGFLLHSITNAIFVCGARGKQEHKGDDGSG